MPCLKLLNCQDATNRASSGVLAEMFASSLVLILLVAMSGCQHQGDVSGRALNPKTISQIRSLSLSGPNQASLLLETTREMKLTTDGGQTWQVLSSAGVADRFGCATMIDSKRGWAVNHQGQVFTTDSGGANWRKSSELTDFTCASQIEFVNEKDGWIRECLSIWRTRDGGTTWRKVLSTLTTGVVGQPTAMFPVSADILVSSGSGGQVYLTKDGGEKWRIETPLTGNIDFNDVWFVDQTHGWLTGYQVLEAGESPRPLLLETTNRGDSWKEISVEADIRPSSVCFIGHEGWLAGGKRIMRGESVELIGVLLYTQDDGKNWTPVQFGPDEPFFTDVRFTDSKNGWLVGRDSLYTTADGGKTWKRVLNLPPIQ